MMNGHQLPYTNEKQLKAERRLYVQIKLSGVEQDEQKEKTKAVKNNGGLTKRVRYRFKYRFLENQCNRTCGFADFSCFC